MIPNTNKRKIGSNQFQMHTGNNRVNHKKKKVNQADICKAKRVKMK